MSFWACVSWSLWSAEGLWAIRSWPSGKMTDVAEAGTEGDKAAGEEQTDQTQEDLYRTQREARVKAYSKVKEQNGDMVGWVKVEGTKIDYPVLQSPDTPDFYLKHDFDKKSSPYGAPYVSEMCDLSADCKNILVYGHHMKNASMFAALDGYLDPDFLEEHPVVEFDTMESYGDYEVTGSTAATRRLSASSFRMSRGGPYMIPA